MCKIRLAALSFFLITMSSCSGTRIRMLENSGAIKTDFSADLNYNYVVLMEGIQYLGWDGNNKQDREDTIVNMFASQCKKIIIADEKSILAGTVQNGREINTWSMRIKCLK